MRSKLMNITKNMVYIPLLRLIGIPSQSRFKTFHRIKSGTGQHYRRNSRRTIYITRAN